MYVSLYVCKRTHDTGEIPSVGQRFLNKQVKRKIETEFSLARRK